MQHFSKDLKFNNKLALDLFKSGVENNLIQSDNLLETTKVLIESHCDALQYIAHLLEDNEQLHAEVESLKGDNFIRKITLKAASFIQKVLGR